MTDSTEATYVAVIFTSQHTGEDLRGYAAAAARMIELAAEQPGYRGMDTLHGADGAGITVSYWATDADALGWKRVTEHLAAQEQGRDTWYSSYRVRVATVHRDYSFPRS